MPLAVNVHKFSAPELLTSLTGLAVEAQSAFAQACAIRTLKSSRLPLAEPIESLCVRALAAAEKAAVSEAMEGAFEGLLEEFDGLPELDDDRVAACAFVVRHLQSGGNPQEAVWAAQRAYEARDQLAQDAMVFQSYTADVEGKLLACPAVQAELQAQIDDIEELAARPSDWRVIVQRAKVVPA